MGERPRHLFSLVQCQTKISVRLPTLFYCDSCKSGLTGVGKPFSVKRELFIGQSLSHILLKISTLKKNKTHGLQFANPCSPLLLREPLSHEKAFMWSRWSCQNLLNRLVTLLVNLTYQKLPNHFIRMVDDKLPKGREGK